MAIISKPFFTRTLKHALNSEFLVKWTLKHGHNFKTPCYRDFGACPRFKTPYYIDFETCIIS
jgi:hypothetical protein